MNTLIKPEVKNYLKSVSERYIWWETVDEAIENPYKIASQIMRFDVLDDHKNLIKIAGNKFMRQVIMQAEAGAFNARSWTFWHYILEITPINKPVPDMPKRIINGEIINFESRWGRSNK